MLKQIARVHQRSNGHNGNGHNGHRLTEYHRRPGHGSSGITKRVDWTDSDDVTAMTMVALGWSSRIIQSKTSLSPGQIEYRKQKAGIKTMDYRHVRANTLGGQIAGQLLRSALRTYRPMVENHLPKDLPTKRESKHGRAA